MPACWDLCVLRGWPPDHSHEDVLGGSGVGPSLPARDTRPRSVECRAPCLSPRVFEDPAGNDDYISVFLHVALMYWSPVRPTLIKLDFVGEEAASQRVHLQATTEALSDYMAFQSISPDHVWETSWYLIEETAEALVCLRPGSISARPLGEPGCCSVGFWPAPRASRPRGQPKAPQAPAAEHSDSAPDAQLATPAGPPPALEEGQGGTEASRSAGEEISDDVLVEEDLEQIMGEDANDDHDQEIEGLLELLDGYWMQGAPSQADGTQHGDEAGSAMASATAGIGQHEGRPHATDSSSCSSAGDSSSDTSSTTSTTSGSKEDSAVSQGAEPSHLAPMAADLVGGRRRGQALCNAPFRGHSLVYYDATERFVVECKLHPKFFKTRTAKPSERCNAQQQGRPLGHLAAWLCAAEAFDTKAAHFEYAPPYEARVAAREELDTIPEPLLQQERPLRPGEAPEPSALP